MSAAEPAVARHVCISVHDVAVATWPACQRLVRMLDDLGGRGKVPLTFLVVPDYHHRGRIDADSGFLRAMDDRIIRGDEIALHGYYHLDEAPPPRNPGAWFQRRMMTDGEGEFAALSAAQASERLEWGGTLWRKLHWPLAGFIAPAWLLGGGGRAAMNDFGFSYTTTRNGIFRLPDWRYTRAPAFAYSVRTPLRRRLSLACLPMQFAALREAPLLRLSLHPVDAGFDAVMRQWRGLITAALATHTPLTKAAWASLDPAVPS